MNWAICVVLPEPVSPTRTMVWWSASSLTKSSLACQTGRAVDWFWGGGGGVSALREVGAARERAAAAAGGGRPRRAGTLVRARFQEAQQLTLALGQDLVVPRRVRLARPRVDATTTTAGSCLVVFAATGRALGPWVSIAQVEPALAVRHDGASDRRLGAGGGGREGARARHESSAGGKESVLSSARAGG